MENSNANFLITESMTRSIEAKKTMEEIEEEYKKFDKNCVMQPSITLEQGLKYILHMLNNKIAESNNQKIDDRDYKERFFLFECRDIVAIMLHVKENPELLDLDDEKENQ